MANTKKIYKNILTTAIQQSPEQCQILNVCINFLN